MTSVDITLSGISSLACGHEARVTHCRQLMDFHTFLHPTWFVLIGGFFHRKLRLGDS